MKKRGWEFMGHGTTNSTNLAGLNPEQERDTIRGILKTIEQATGKRPRGWLGSGLIETYNTLDILAEEGVIYCGDWNNDDQPYPMKVKSGKMFAIPYCNEINDIPLYIRKGYTGEQYFRSVIDQFDALYADSRKQPRVMGVPLHPDDLRPAAAHQIPAARHRPHEGAPGRVVCDRRRDHRRLPDGGLTPNAFLASVCRNEAWLCSAKTASGKLASFGQNDDWVRSAKMSAAPVRLPALLEKDVIRRVGRAVEGAGLVARAGVDAALGVDPLHCRHAREHALALCARSPQA